MERAYRNVGYVFLALVPIFIAGFWIPYLSRLLKFDPSINAVVHIHAALLFVWLGLLIFQPLAIRHGALRVHRIVGKTSYLLMPMVAISAMAVIWKESGENVTEGAGLVAARNAEFLSATQLVLLVVFYGLAIFSIKKRNVAAHTRYMICLALILLPAGLARVFGYWFGITQVVSQTVCFILIDLCLVFLAATGGRNREAAAPYILALSTYAVVEVSWLALGRPV